MPSGFKLLSTAWNDDDIVAIIAIAVSTATIIVAASKVFCL